MSDILGAFVDELKNREDVLGVILFGSWARGTNRGDSDFDLLVIQREGFLRTVEYRGNRAFELTFTTVEGATEFWKENRDDCVGLWDVAKILYDKDDTLKQLREAADKIKREGKDPLDEVALEHLRFDAEDSIRAVRGLIGQDNATAQLILCNKVSHLSELYFDIRQLWMPAPKQRLDQIKRTDPELYEQIVRFFGETDLDQKVQIVSSIISLVFHTR
jgi:predicted nucleotidyltransferase